MVDAQNFDKPNASYFQVLELLLHNDATSKGVNVNIRDAKGNTPLHIALSR